ncbi:MAG: phosphatase PAP2 family protein [Bdellovibrionales bacterium]
MDFLQSLDLALFHWINATATHPLLDFFFANITNLHRVKWISLGLLPLLIAIALWRAGWRGLKTTLVLALAIGACDFVNHRMIKPAVARERPFHSDVVGAFLRIEPAPRGYSFPSNHAVNTMAGAVLLGAYFPPVRMVVYPVSILVGYSRPYLGVHYPFDIVFGWLQGALVAWLAIWALRKWAPSWAPAVRKKNEV